MPDTREYSNFGLGPITTRWTVDGYGWTHISDQAHNAMVWLLSPCGASWALTELTPRERWKLAHWRQRMIAKERTIHTGTIGRINGVSIVRTEHHRA